MDNKLSIVMGRYVSNGNLYLGLQDNNTGKIEDITINREKIPANFGYVNVHSISSYHELFYHQNIGEMAGIATGPFHNIVLFEFNLSRFKLCSPACLQNRNDVIFA